MPQHRLDDVAHRQVVGVALVVEDVAPGDGRLVEVPGEDAVAERQVREPVRVQLDDGGLADAFEQVGARVGRDGGECGRLTEGAVTSRTVGGWRLEIPGTERQISTVSM